MKNPKIQNLKTIIAIIVLITTSIIIYKYRTLQNKIAIITKDENKKITEIKYARGTEIIEKVQNDGEKQKSNSLDLRKQKESLVNKIDLNLEDKASPDRVDNIHTRVIEDNIIVDLNKPNDNGTNYEYLIKNNHKEKIMKYYAKSNIKGYSYSIDSNPNGTASIEANKLDDSPITKKINGWDEDYYIHIRTIDNAGNYSENNTFKIDVPSDGLDVEYIDMNTGEKIVDEEKINGNIKQEYNITNLIKEIDNYQLIDIDGSLEGMLQKEKKEVVCKYAKNCRIQVNYKDRNTGKEISDCMFIEGYEGKDIFIKARNIEGYYYSEKGIKTTMTEEKNYIDIFYDEIPKGKISVKYVDKENQKCIDDSYIIEGYIGTDYKTEKREIKGYELIQEPNNLEGTIDSSETEVIYYYSKIKQKDENITKEKVGLVKYVDYDTKKVIETEKIQPNKKNTIKIKKIEGYRIMDKEEFDKENSIIDELINSLEIDQNYTEEKTKNENVITPKKNKSSKLSEYEIVMNCDDSDYIIYYKK